MNTCWKWLRTLHHYTIMRLIPTPCISVHVENKVDTARAAETTIIHTYSRKRSATPVAVDQHMLITSIHAFMDYGLSEGDLTFSRSSVMHQHPEVSDLLEQYMEVSGTAECWLTVRELRSFFQIEGSAGPAISGFLQRIHHGSFHSCRYRVIRMEKFRDSTPPYRIIKRYLIQARPPSRPSLIKNDENPRLPTATTSTSLCNDIKF